MALLDAYAQPLSATQVAHLLRRATFGPTPEQIKSLSGKTAAQLVAQLLADQPLPPPPIDPQTKQTFHDQPFVQDNAGRYNGYVKAWWAGLMLNQPVSVLEPMTLFWSNHFVTNYTSVVDYRYSFRYNALLRQHALGNFKAFATAITQDPAMLRFLSGNQNTAGKPNENYGRELQELFTVGRNGGYTEDDVKAAARVLTGWRNTGYRVDTRPEISTVFQVSDHDITNKTFSAAYGNTVIKGRTGPSAGLDELSDLLDMLLRNPEMPRYICRKFYRWFINDDITPAIETGFIQPLADVFRKANFEIKPVLSALFQSQHFFDTALIGSMIKAPANLVVGTFRFFGIQAPDPVTSAAAFYSVGGYLSSRLSEEQQTLLDPPDVFGWTAYYKPGYYQQWINSTTIGLRGYLGDQLTTGNLKLNGKSVFDPVAYAKTIPNADDPAKLVAGIVTPLLAVPPSAQQIDFLTDTVLLNNLPRYEWTAEWGDYTRAPNDTAKKQAVQIKLTGFMQYVFRMAEYQVN